MVSHYHKCIFIHIPKAAGTSIELFFLKDLNLDLYNRHSLLLGENTNRDFGARRISHLTINDLLKYHFISNDQFENYFKFTFVRNPIDRLYSTYKYFLYHNYISFDFFVQKKLETLFTSDYYKHFFLPQHSYIYNEDRNMLDFIGKFENIQDDFEVVKKALNMTDKNLEHYNKAGNWVGNKKDINSIQDKTKILFKIISEPSIWFRISTQNNSKELNKKSIDIVKKLYEKDFELFNYSIPS